MMLTFKNITEYSLIAFYFVEYLTKLFFVVVVVLDAFSRLGPCPIILGKIDIVFGIFLIIKGG